MKPLSLDAVRGLMIAAQGLHDRPQPRLTKKAVRSIIRQMHLLQIDSISVIARSPYLVLWSRLGDYNPRWLDELLAEGALFEYWSHAACFLPIEEYALYRHLYDSWLGGRAHQWLQEHAHVAKRVLDHVRTHGEARSSDFERTDGQKANWWNWKDEKIALEYLFYAGELMVRKRHNFQRVYDLRERVLANVEELPSVSPAEAHEQFVLNTIQALGVTKAEWIADYFRLSKTDTRAALKRLAQQDRLMTVEVEGWTSPGYIHPANRKQVESAAKGKVPRSKTTFLSPFDPLVWDRKRALDLFNFDYKIEVYTPAPKRKYGYFTLPILYNNALIGRIDPKAHRKEGVFEVKALHLEPGVKVDDALVTEVKSALRACAAWHKTPQVVVRHASKPGLARRLSD
ncbi:MAG TPA: crosslink repair DNA glycosylase YcaQ family protein [Anaerolineales bacterium]|nr:crosslink repair DNA glycosylase YcaQ family protein [Anaerolineales bacterium]